MKAPMEMTKTEQIRRSNKYNELMWVCNTDTYYILCILRILPGKGFEDTFKITQWKRPHKCNQCNYASSQAGTLNGHLKAHSGEKLNKCNQCDYTSCYASALRTHLKKSPIDATNVIMHPLRQAIWGLIWKYTVEKNQTIVISLTLHPHRQAIWGNIWQNTVENPEE